MSNIIQNFIEFADYVALSSDWKSVHEYLKRVSTYKRGWRLATVCLRQLMKKVQTPRQASIVSRLYVEWMPADCPPSIQACLLRAERQMYERLHCGWGIERSIFQEIASSPEGRKYLKSLRQLGEHKK